MLAFFQHLWGSADGYRCIATLSPNGRFKHYWHTNNDKAAACVVELMAMGATAIYHANGLFKTKDRTQEQAQSLGAFFFDFDFKTGGDKEEFASQLRTFLAATKLPVPTMVKSGGGVHCYWFLDTPLPAAQWTQVALQLKALMKHHGFKTDPTATADSARVLRPVGTTNYKYEPERQVKLSNTLTQFPTDAIVGLIEQAAEVLPVKPKADISEILGAAPAHLVAPNINSDLTSGTDLPPPGCKPIVKGCAQIAAQASVQGAGVSEPLWYAAVGVLRHTRESRKIIHLVSCKHEGYDADATDRKIEQHKLPPTTCQHFSDLDHAACKACPHAGRIKSPISLGYRSLDLEEVTEVVVKKVDPFGEDEEEVVESVPAAPKGFKITARGLEAEFLDKDTGEYEWRDVTPVKFWVADSYLESREGKSDGEASVMSIRFRVVPPRNPPFYVDMPAATYGNKNKLREFLSNYMQIFPKDDASMNKIGNYIGAVINRRQTEEQSSAMIGRFGWQQDGSFVLGETQYLPNGERVRVALAPGQSAAQLAPRFGVRGSADVWRNVVARMNTRAHAAHQATILYAMASPLLTLLGTECGALWHLYTNLGGQGKSTLTKIAAAAMGNAFSENGLLTTPDDSAYGRTKVTATTCHTTQFWDEVTRDADGEAVSKMLYTFTSGQEGVKGKASGGLRTGEGGWRCGAISSGNRSVRDLIETARKGEKATSLRVLEVPLTMIADEELGVMANELADNYGHVADSFLQYLVTHQALIRTRAAGIRAHCADRFQLKPDERFWARTIEAIILCGDILNELGWVAFDMSAISAYLDVLLDLNRNDFSSRASSGADLVRNFVAENSTRALMVRGHTTAMVTTPHRDEFRGDRVVVRIVEDEGMMYLDCDVFKQWLQRQHGMSFTEVIRSINRNLEAPAAEFTGERKRMNGGTNLPVLRTTVVSISMTFGPLVDLFDLDLSKTEQAVGGDHE